YPGVFPNLAALTASGASRADLVAILLTGIPAGIIPGFQNSNGPTPADELRLNLAFAPSYDPTDSGINPPGDSAKRFGLLGGDLKRPPWHKVEGGRLLAGDGWLHPADRCAIRRGVEARGGPRRTGAAVPVPVARTTGGGDEPPSPQGP